jgi:hypothetical protein
MWDVVVLELSLSPALSFGRNYALDPLQMTLVKRAGVATGGLLQAHQRALLLRHLAPRHCQVAHGRLKLLRDKDEENPVPQPQYHHSPVYTIQWIHLQTVGGTAHPLLAEARVADRGV